MSGSGEKYLVRLRGEMLGECTYDEIRRQLKNDRLGRFHKLSNDMGKTWRYVHEFSEFADRERLPPQGGNSKVDEPGIFPMEGWHVSINKKQMGPYPVVDLQTYFAEGRFQKNDLVWHKSLGGWKPYKDVQWPGSAPESDQSFTNPRRHGMRIVFAGLGTLVSGAILGQVFSKFVFVGLLGTGAALVVAGVLTIATGRNVADMIIVRKIEARGVFQQMAVEAAKYVILLVVAIAVFALMIYLFA